jgi:hypothetical protein
MALLTLIIVPRLVFNVATFIVPVIFVVPAVEENVLPVATELKTPPVLIVIFVAGEAVVVAFRTPPLLIVTLDPAPEAVGLNVGVVKVPAIVIFKARPVGIEETVGRTLPPALMLTMEVGAKVVEFKTPFTFKVPSGVEVPDEVSIPVDPMVVVEVAVGLNCVVVIAPFKFSVPAGAEVVPTVNFPPLSTVVVKAALGLKLVVVLNSPIDFTLRLPEATVFPAA